MKLTNLIFEFWNFQSSFVPTVILYSIFVPFLRAVCLFPSFRPPWQIRTAKWHSREYEIWNCQPQWGIIIYHLYHYFLISPDLCDLPIIPSRAESVAPQLKTGEGHSSSSQWRRTSSCHLEGRGGGGWGEEGRKTAWLWPLFWWQLSCWDTALPFSAQILVRLLYNTVQYTTLLYSILGATLKELKVKFF